VEGGLGRADPCGQTATRGAMDAVALARTCMPLGLGTGRNPCRCKVRGYRKPTGQLRLNAVLAEKLSRSFARVYGEKMAQWTDSHAKQMAKNQIVIGLTPRHDRSAPRKPYPAIVACICGSRKPTAQEIRTVARRILRETAAQRAGKHKPTFGILRWAISAAKAALAGSNTPSRPALPYQPSR
jgi:hypothetical protein